MTEAEIIEKITKKRNELEEKTAAKASVVVIKALEAEIKELENSIGNGGASQTQEQQMFLDECAG